MGGQRHQGCSGNSQPGMQGVLSGPGEAAASMPPELEDALPTLCQNMCPQTAVSIGSTFGEKHIPGGLEECRELIRWRDSGKLPMREVGWAAVLNSRKAAWKNSRQGR